MSKPHYVKRDVVHNTGHRLLHCRRRLAEPRLQASDRVIYSKFREVLTFVFFEICERTDRHTDMSAAIRRTSPGGELTKW